MKTEDLKTQGLTEEQIKFVMAENGKDIEAQKALTATEATKVAAAEKTIRDLQETVKQFDGVDVGKLKKDVADWEQKYNEDLGAAKLNNALDLALINAKAKNPKLAKAALDLSAIKLDGDKLLGLDDQLTKLKESDGYLFDEEDKGDEGNTVRVNSGTQHQSSPREAGPSSLVDALKEHYKGD